LDDLGVGRRFGPEGDLVGEVERPEMCEGTPEPELRNVEWTGVPPIVDDDSTSPSYLTH
jgi:hypothetical protein